MLDVFRKPRLRWPLDISAQELADKRRVLILRCPLGISEQPLVLLSEIAPVIAAFDGEKTCEALLSEFGSYGLTPEILHQLIALLDDAGFLDGEKFSAMERKARSDFSALDIRPSALAGGVYSSSPSSLRNEVIQFLSSKTLKGSSEARPPLVAMSAPHIDYRRGGGTYGVAYTEERLAKVDLFILFGTAHQYSPHLFHASTKDYETPLGVVRTDREFVAEVQRKLGRFRGAQDEFLHKREHSLEIQLPFLQTVCPESRIVPILMGSFHRCIQKNCSPEDLEEYQALSDALGEVIMLWKSRGKNVCLLASVDMAHIGKAFGDGFELTAEKLAEIRARDEEYLGFLVEGNRGALWEHIVEDGDARRVCGYPSMYLLLDLLNDLYGKTTGVIQEYRQAVDVRVGCAVTFAAVQFELPSVTLPPS